MSTFVLLLLRVGLGEGGRGVTLLDDPAVAEATDTATIRPITLSTSAGPASLSAVRVNDLAI